MPRLQQGVNGGEGVGEQKATRGQLMKEPHKYLTMCWGLAKDLPKVMREHVPIASDLSHVLCQRHLCCGLGKYFAGSQMRNGGNVPRMGCQCHLQIFTKSLHFDRIRAALSMWPRARMGTSVVLIALAF